MIGAIIGDLAAWTWEHNHEEFYPRLVASNAELSEYGQAIFAAYNIVHKVEATADRVKVFDGLRSSLSHIQLQPESHGDLNAFLMGHKQALSPATRNELFIAICLAAGWCDSPRQVALTWLERLAEGKESYYFIQAAEVIYRLRHGATKKEAIKDTHYIIDWVCAQDKGQSPLYYASLAWRCFVESWDFTSAIHNAARTPCRHPHMLATITGAFAGAMYGCEWIMLKKKFRNPSNKVFVELPEEVLRSHKKELREIRDYEDRMRMFFPKNHALTNVEWHHFKTLNNALADICISDEEYKRIVKSFYTDWDHRYGLYLDDGWLYTYRSHVLFARLKMERQSDGWHITQIQDSGEGDLEQVYLSVCGAFTGCDYYNKEFVVRARRIANAE